MRQSAREYFRHRVADRLLGRAASVLIPRAIVVAAARSLAASRARGRRLGGKV
jgi:hypothetical protein